MNWLGTGSQAPGGDPWWKRALGWVAFAALVLVVGTLAGQQIATPNMRMLQVVAAGLLVLLAFRSKSVSALMLAVLFLPFPKGTSYGNTNSAFILLIFIIWLYRVSRKLAPPPRWTAMDVPVIGLVMAYALSFYNVDNTQEIPLAWSIYLSFFTYLFLAYMVINIVRTTEDVQKIVMTQSISCALVCLIGVYEVFNPSSVIIPGWIEFSGGYEFVEQGVRIGSTFLDFELFAEFCTLNLLLQIFLLQRAKTKSRRFAIAALMGLTLFCLFATVTRGAILSLSAGLVYLLWLSRRRVNFVRLVGLGAVAVVLVLGADQFVSRFTRSASVLERLMGTELKGGVVPETRAGVWEQAINNILDHPVIGHGPYYPAERGLVTLYWPHSLYLFYAYIVGAVGLAFFLWILATLWKATRPRAASPGSGTWIEGATVIFRVMLLTFMVDQIKIEYLRNERYSYFVWMMFGLMMAIGNVARTEAAQRQASSEGPAIHPGTTLRPGPRPGAVSARPAIYGT